MITGAYSPARCGVGDYTHELCNSLAAAGVEVTVLTSSYLGTQQNDHNPRVCPKVGSWSLIGGLKTLRTILAIPSDICHFQMPSQEYQHRLWPFLLIPLVKALAKPKKVIVTFHELPPVEFRRNPLLGAVRFLRAWLCSLGADAVVVVAEDYQKELTKRYKRSRQVPLTVIPIASNIPRSTLTSDQLAAARSKLGIKTDCILLAHFGFINPPKGFENALDVVASLVRQGKEAKLIVLGELSPQNPYHAQILNRIAQEHLAGHITVLGYMEQVAVADHLAMADVCILPFRGGLHPKSTSFLAATAQGTYVVTTSRERAGLDESTNVYFVAPGDIGGMVDGVLQRAARRGDESTRLEQGWPFVAEQHIALYNRLMARPVARESNACSVRV